MLELNISNVGYCLQLCVFPALENLDMNLPDVEMRLVPSSFSWRCGWLEYELRVLSIGRIPEWEYSKGLLQISSGVIFEPLNVTDI